MTKKEMIHHAVKFLKRNGHMPMMVRAVSVTPACRDIQHLTLVLGRRQVPYKRIFNAFNARYGDGDRFLSMQRQWHGHLRECGLFDDDMYLIQSK